MQPSRALSVLAASIAVVVGGTVFATVPRAASAADRPDEAPSVSAAPVESEVPLPTGTSTSAPTAHTTVVPAPEPSSAAAPASDPTVAASAAPEPTAPVTPVPSTISFTYAGDSITSRPDSWMRQLHDPAFTNVGGTAIGGATSAKILANTSAHPADVLVVMAGTNDLRFGTSNATVLRNIDQITKQVGAEHVVVAAIAPSNITDYGTAHIDRRKAGEILNRDLQNRALTRGWLFVDPWAADRYLNGGWSASRTTDGVHPTAAVSAKASVRMGQAITIAFAGAAS